MGHARRPDRPSDGRTSDPRGLISSVHPGVPRHEFGWRIVIHLIPLYETRSDSAASTPRPTPRRRATSHGTEPKTHVGDLRRSSARGNRAVTDRPPSSSGPPVRNRRQYWAEGVRHRSRSEAVIPNADRPRAAGSVLALVADTRPRNDTPGVLDILVYDTSAVRDPLREVENRSSFLVRRTGASDPVRIDAPRRGFLVGRRPSRGASPRATQAGQYGYSFRVGRGPRSRTATEYGTPTHGGTSDVPRVRVGVKDRWLGSTMVVTGPTRGPTPTRIGPSTPGDFESVGSGSPCGAPELPGESESADRGRSSRSGTVVDASDRHRPGPRCAGTDAWPIANVLLSDEKIVIICFRSYTGTTDTRSGRLASARPRSERTVVPGDSRDGRFNPPTGASRRGVRRSSGG